MRTEGWKNKSLSRQKEEKSRKKGEWKVRRRRKEDVTKKISTIKRKGAKKKVQDSYRRENLGTRGGDYTMGK